MFPSVGVTDIIFLIIRKWLQLFTLANRNFDSEMAKNSLKLHQAKHAQSANCANPTATNLYSTAQVRMLPRELYTLRSETEIDNIDVASYNLPAC